MYLPPSVSLLLLCLIPPLPNPSLCTLFVPLFFSLTLVYEAFEQWKKLVHLLCFSEQSLLKHVNLFLNLIGLLHFQLKEIPDDFFVDIVSKDNFLTKTLQVTNYIATIEYPILGIVSPCIVLEYNCTSLSFCYSYI